MNETRDVIGDQHRRLGASVDWSRLRFTMDEGSARAVRVAFKRLYDDGLAYRGEQLINWCPGCRTSLSDLEVIATPEHGTLWSVRYHLVRDDGTPDPDDTITVATTRPETILGDTAVAVHPDDARYARAGRAGTVLIPFVDRVVPVIADAVVDREFGTGAVKITPAHDHDDFDTGQRHGLAMIDVMTDDGHINENGGPYAGLTPRGGAHAQSWPTSRRAATWPRCARTSWCIGRCERSDDIVEPRLKTQWFINVKPMAERAMAVGARGPHQLRAGALREDLLRLDGEHPRLERQPPAVVGPPHPGVVLPGRPRDRLRRADGPDACAVCGRPPPSCARTTDIFDTWFSSGLWPFSTLGWPDETPDLRALLPDHASWRPATTSSSSGSRG